MILRSRGTERPFAKKRKGMIEAYFRETRHQV